jgi:hypothetical protein
MQFGIAKLEWKSFLEVKRVFVSMILTEQRCFFNALYVLMFYILVSNST